MDLLHRVKACRRAPPFHIGTIAEIWDVEGAPASTADVVPADLHAQPLADIEEQICQVGAQGISAASSYVCKPA